MYASSHEFHTQELKNQSYGDQQGLLREDLELVLGNMQNPSLIILTGEGICIC